MNWKDIVKEEDMPKPPKSRFGLKMTCKNNHTFTLGEAKKKKKLGSRDYQNFSDRCPICGEKATFVKEE